MGLFWTPDMTGAFGAKREGDRRLPARRQRERRGTGALPHRAAPPRPHRRGPRDDLASMAARACSPPCRSSGTAFPSGGAGRTGSGTSSTGSAQPTGRASAPGPSLPCATIPTICSPASATGPLPGEGRSGPPTPANRDLDDIHRFTVESGAVNSGLPATMGW